MMVGYGVAILIAIILFTLGYFIVKRLIRRKLRKIRSNMDNTKMVKYPLKCSKCNAEYTKEFPEDYAITTFDREEAECPNGHKGSSHFPNW